MINFDQILRLDNDLERFENENQVVPYLRIITGYRYGLEISLRRKWGNEDSPLEEGKFYQFIPDKVDDGFFDWYCDNCPYHRFFHAVEMALPAFRVLLACMEE